MTAPDDDEKPLDPAQADIVAKVRRLMLLSGVATALGIGVVVTLIGYRLFRAEGSAAPETVALLPKGAKILSTAVAGDRLLVTIDVGGATEIRAYDPGTLRPTGRLRFAVEP